MRSVVRPIFTCERLRCSPDAGGTGRSDPADARVGHIVRSVEAYLPNLRRSPPPTRATARVGDIRKRSRFGTVNPLIRCSAATRSFVASNVRDSDAFGAPQNTNGGLRQRPPAALRCKSKKGRLMTNFEKRMGVMKQPRRRGLSIRETSTNSDWSSTNNNIHSRNNTSEGFFLPSQK